MNPVSIRRLEVFLTTRCNLDCRYCSSKTLVHRKAQRSLSFEELKRAMRLFVACPGAGRGPRGVAFTGGEPFLEFETLARTIEHIRGYKEDFEVCVSTNGTFLTEEKMRFLRAKRVNLTLSLDGGREVNDSNRRFRDASGASVYDAVAARLRTLSREALEYPHVIVTVSSDAVPRIVESVEALRALGLRHIELCFDVYERWDARKLESVRRVFSRSREYFVRHLNAQLSARGECDVLDAYFMSDLGSNIVSPFSTLCLSPDARFFPCDTLCGLGDGKTGAVGDLERGVDWKKLARTHAEVLRSAGDRGGPIPSIDRHFYARIRGLDPKVMRKGYDELDAMSGREFGCLERAQQRLTAIRRAGLLDRFTAPPGRRSRGELACVALSAGDGDFARARQAVDDCLYSPGSEKSVVIRVASLDARLDYAESVGLYAVMKARYLGKRLRVLVESEAADARPDRLRFFGDHGMFLGLPGPSGLERAYGILRFSRGDAARLGERLEAAGRQGLRWAKLELRDDGCLWSDEELGSLQDGMRAVEAVLLKAALSGRGPCLVNLSWSRETRPVGRQDPRAPDVFRACLDSMRRRLTALAGRRPEVRRFMDEVSRMSRARSGFLAGPG
ncbi:MAG: radical SAM protein [Elusimicrobiota bacterium]